MTVLKLGRHQSPIFVRSAVALLILGGVVLLYANNGFFQEDRWGPFLEPSTWRFLGEGLAVTLAIGTIALILSLLIGVPLGMARAGLQGPLRYVVGGYIELVRATPILAILLITLLGLPRLGLDIEPFWAGVVALTMYTSAVLGEIVRAGIGSIPRGEVEAARSLGLTYRHTMRRVVLPQALARMTPAIVSQLITLIKDTSLLFIIGVQELVGYGRSFFNFYGNLLETYFVIAVIFFLINYPLSRVSRRLESGRPADERVAVSGEEDQVAVRAP
ncbi:MAG: amino acid ABC transporter permease [Chloroflexota bacterium]|nr:amino acid ABC transporter permease [Chloroflexota bacterium]